MNGIQEPFADGASLLHRLDPRGKVAVAAVFAVTVAVAKTVPAVLAGFLLSLVGLVLARLPLKQVIGRLLVANSFVLFLWLVLPLTYPGEAVFALGPLSVSREGLILAGLITVKSNTLLIALIALVATIPVVTLGQALHMMRLPNKLCHLLLFTYRYLHVLEQEFHRLVQAMRIRGFQPRTNLHSYRSCAYLAAMLLVHSYDRADRVFQAMLCRGFHGIFYSLRTFSWHCRDGVFVVAAVLALAVVLYLEWGLPGVTVRLG